MSSAVDKYLTELKKQEAELMEGLVVSPSDSLEKYHMVVGKVLGIRMSIDALMQQLADDK